MVKRLEKQKLSGEWIAVGYCNDNVSMLDICDQRDKTNDYKFQRILLNLVNVYTIVHSITIK